jgi:hypothetical protein
MCVGLQSHQGKRKHIGGKERLHDQANSLSLSLSRSLTALSMRLTRHSLLHSLEHNSLSFARAHAHTLVRSLNSLSSSSSSSSSSRRAG